MDKRLTALLAALLLAVLALVACTGGGDEAGSGEATANATPTPTATATRIATPEPAEIAADRAVLVGSTTPRAVRTGTTARTGSDARLGYWYGVTTDIDGRVSVLKLAAGLRGPIPPELGNLTHLRHLYLGGYPFPDFGPQPVNYLSGPIPPELGRLSKLKTLNLVNNELSGPIPAELGRLSNLEGLWLSSNQLSGPSVVEQRFCQCKRAATLSVRPSPSEDAAAPVWRPGTPLART